MDFMKVVACDTDIVAIVRDALIQKSRIIWEEDCNIALSGIPTNESSYIRPFNEMLP